VDRTKHRVVVVGGHHHHIVAAEKPPQSGVQRLGGVLHERDAARIARQPHDPHEGPAAAVGHTIGLERSPVATAPRRTPARPQEVRHGIGDGRRPHGRGGGVIQVVPHEGVTG
jgi:hypothetical protein